MKKINTAQLKQLVEAAIFVADKPISKQHLKETVLNEFTVADRTLSKVINELKLDYQPRGIQLVEVASGYRFQSLDALSPWLSKLWQENAPKYSRAMLETLALIAYRQPITRGEIEQVRGVAVSSNIIKTLTVQLPDCSVKASPTVQPGRIAERSLIGRHKPPTERESTVSFINMKNMTAPDTN